MRNFLPLSTRLRSRTLRGLVVLTGTALFVSSAPSASLLVDSVTDGPLEFSSPAILGESDASSGGPVPGDININQFLGADRFYHAGYTGTRAVLANVEAGVVWDGHQDFSAPGHINYMAPVGGALATAATIDFHATAVAGMMTSRGGSPYPAEPHRWGISHGAQFWTGGVATAYPPFAFSTSFSSNTTAVARTYEQAVLAGMGPSGVIADVVNSSWGTTGGNSPSGFTAFGFIMDTLARESRSLLVFSAGNSGPGVNTLGGPAAAYNTLAVGALQGPAFEQLANFSSRSPSTFALMQTPFNALLIPGARAAVDLVAPGTDLLTPLYGGQTGGNQSGADIFGWTPTSDDLYRNLNGTSFSAPLVAGGAALLVDAGRDLYASDADAVDALILKAVLLNSADKLPGWTNAQAEVAQVGGRFGTDTVLRTTRSLDYGFGAGRMNLDRAFDQYVVTTSGGMAVTTNVGANISGDLGAVGVVGWDFGSVQIGTPNTYFISDMLSGGSRFSTTLAWFGDRDYDVENSNYPDYRFSDLDLSVFAYDPLDMSILGTVAESVSIYNLVEHLWFDLPETGYYGIRVDYFGDLWNFYGEDRPAEYGLAWSGVLFAVPEPGRAMLLLGSVFFLILRRRRP